MLFIIAALSLLGGFLAITSNPDIFSPSKFFMLFFALFHVGAFFEWPSTQVLALVLIVLFVILIITIVEGAQTQYYPAPNVPLVDPKLVHLEWRVILPLIWILSGPGLLAQLYIIAHFGGVEGYVASISTRVEDWRGLGWARTLISTLPVFNVAYFCFLIRGRPTVRAWGVFAVHLSFVLLVGLLSGSRSGLLNIVALLCVCFHYQRRPFSIPLAAGIISLLVFSASVLGVARQNFKFADGQLSTGLSNSTESMSLNAFSYGIEPLQLIVDSPRLILAHGSTFLSLLTNAIPRSLFPGKPDTGGVFLTKEYAGDAWLGLSNLTPTFLGEWIINFGWLAGIIGFFLTYGGASLAILFFYRRLLRDQTRPRDTLYVVDFVIYVHVLWTLVSLMPGEFTAVVLGHILTQLVPLLLLRFMVVRARLGSRVARVARGQALAA